MRFVLAGLLGVMLGFMLMILPGVVGKPYPGSVSALVDSAVEGMSPMQMLLVFAGGFLLGLVLKWPYSLIAAICELWSLPIIVVADIVRDPTSHNLWPFEFVFFAVLSIIPVLGMSFAKVLQRVFKANRDSPGKGSGAHKSP